MTGNILKLPTIDSTKPTPRAPRDLGREGKRMWRNLWRLPWLEAERDFPTVLEAARVADDLANARAAIAEHGLLLGEPVQNSRGDVIGNKVVANPAEAMARRATTALITLLQTLGLSPAAATKLKDGRRVSVT
jgi:P27 family predicted phage terminase small subunit